MASRRNRIKGIANIPQRRKPSATTKEEISEENNVKLCEEEPQNESNLTSANNEKNIDSQFVTDKSAENVDNNKIEEVSVDSNVPPEHSDSPKPLLNRRRFIKPTVTAHLLNRNRNKLTPVLTTEDCIKPPEPLLKELSSDPIKSPSASTSTDISSLQKKHTDVIQIKSPEHVNFTLNETAILPNNLSSLQKQDEINGANQSSTLGIRRIPINFTIDTKSGSDTEYSGASHSPNKIFNRSRIKAIPRFGQQRRTSYSASESEDDSRRIGNRNRNDSVCSSTSGIQDQPNLSDVGVQKKEFSSVIQRKCKRTEQSRKLAEARREFQLKFGDAKPDKQKLTMIDLIFYNPTTNPMSQKKKRNLSTDENNENPTEDQPAKETVDDPTQSDEENELPAPQIKIGPNGEIIVDEKSLVIENKEVKKNREELQKSALVDGDFDTSYGVYKKVKRSKDWSQTETVRFYKALNTIGTDFTLMCELFPKRSRRELKMKFKKEERMNRALVDRAVMQPKNYDLTELKNEVEMEERELAKVVKLKEIRKENRSKCKKTTKSTYKSRFAKMCEIEDAPSDRVTRQKSTRSKNGSVNLKRGIQCVLDNESDKSEGENNSDSDSTLDEIVNKPKPKRTKKTLRKPHKEKGKEKASNNGEMKKTLEPGSIMILSTKGNKGESVYKVYMVAPGQESKPINVASITESNGDVQGSVTDLFTISENKNNLQENNVTIPAEENITIPAENTETGSPKQNNVLDEPEGKCKAGENNLQENNLANGTPTQNVMNENDINNTNKSQENITLKNTVTDDSTNS